MKVYYNKTRIGVVIFTGIGESVDGYRDKYRQIAEYLYMKKGVSIFIVPVSSWTEKNSLIEETMAKIAEYYRQVQIEDYELYLMGLSAGASFIINEHYKFERVTKILAINPVLYINLDKIILALNQSQIPITFVFAEKDPSCIFLKLVDLEKNGRNKVEIIEGADHEFSEHFDEFLLLPEKYFF